MKSQNVKTNILELLFIKSIIIMHLNVILLQKTMNVDFISSLILCPDFNGLPVGAPKWGTNIVK